MGLFNKISQGANRLFTKVSGDHNIFKKVGDYGKHINNQVQKVGNFIKPVADAFGYGHLVDGAMNMSKTISNNLEKYTAPLHNAHTQIANHFA